MFFCLFVFDRCSILNGIKDVYHWLQIQSYGTGSGCCVFFRTYVSMLVNGVAVALTGRWSPLCSPSLWPEPRPRWCTAATPQHVSHPELSARTSCCLWRSRRPAAGPDHDASWLPPMGKKNKKDEREEEKKVKKLKFKHWSSVQRCCCCFWDGCKLALQYVSPSFLFYSKLCIHCLAVM